ncbi:efflux ABC transporter domain protein, partial [Acinetobacter sp. 25977_10]
MRNLLKPLLLQSFRTGGLYLLIIALSLAISATTALKFSNDQVKNAVSLQASQMLAADLVLSNNEPLDTKWQKKPSPFNKIQPRPIKRITSARDF